LLCQQADFQRKENRLLEAGVGITHVNQAERSSTRAIMHGRLLR
jgi:hypothetical protein